MSDKYRMDGSPYPDGDEGLFEWAKDFKDTRGRIIGQTLLWNGIWLSTVWLGIDHNFGRYGPPLIFETMAFNKIGGHGWEDLEMERYSTIYEAEEGHFRLMRQLSSVKYTLLWWWSEIMKHVFEEHYDY